MPYPGTPAPPLPVPNPNTAMLNVANNTSKHANIVNKEVVTLKSKVPRTMGDEAGVNGGIMSGMNLGEASF